MFTHSNSDGHICILAINEIEADKESKMRKYVVSLSPDAGKLIDDKEIL